MRTYAAYSGYSHSYLALSCAKQEVTYAIRIMTTDIPTETARYALFTLRASTRVFYSLTISVQFASELHLKFDSSKSVVMRTRIRQNVQCCLLFYVEDS